MSGVIVLNKPRDTSSAWYVYLLRPILGTRRIGHAGSLDPFAEGVLLACVDRGCKLTESLMGLPKHYQATVQLGVTNLCHDTEQPVEPYPNARRPCEQEVRQALGRFEGEIQQIPPAFSAVQIQGVRAYDLARSEQKVAIPPRAVRIYRLALREYVWPWLKFEVICGRGTYIRALVRDIGESLGCGGVCTELTRVAVGPFALPQAIRLRGLTQERVEEHVLPVDHVKQMVAGYTAPPTGEAPPQ